MKNKKKIIFVIIIGIGAAILAWFLYALLMGFFIGGFFFPTLTYEKTEKIFTKDSELLTIVCDYFQDSNYEELYIPLFPMKSGTMSNAGTDVEIEDSAAVDAIRKLSLKGYSVINRDGNTISFQRWSKFHNVRGIAYSIDGSDPQLEYLTKLEPLSEDNWFYYEEDYNEWKSLNNT